MRILFGFHVGSNTGYAITSLEKVFFAAGSKLVEDPSHDLYFSFKNLSKGPPQSLPDGFSNIVAFDFSDVSEANMGSFAKYCRERRIELVVFVDLEPVHPLVKALKSAGVDTVLTYWGAPVSRIPTGMAGAINLRIKRLLVALSSSKVDGLIFESKSMADSAVHGRGFPSSKVVFSYLGVDIDRFSPRRRTEINSRFGFDPAKKLVIYSGHMEERKGVSVIIEAAGILLNEKKRKDVCFLLCGNKPGEADGFERRVKELGVADSVKFGGYRDDLPELFASGFCCVIASTGWDSFTYSSIEMTASGLPLVVSRLQGLAEAALDGVTGLHFTPGDSLELAEKICLLLDHPEEAERLGRNGRARAEKELHFEHHAAELAMIFTDFMRSPMRR